jgi:hypothetical protein
MAPPSVATTNPTTPLPRKSQLSLRFLFPIGQKLPKILHYPISPCLEQFLQPAPISSLQKKEKVPSLKQIIYVMFFDFLSVFHI